MSKIASAEIEPADLYERDYYGWIQNQVRALGKRRVDEIDWANVPRRSTTWGKAKSTQPKATSPGLASTF